MQKTVLISFVVSLFFICSPCNAQHTDVDTSKAYAFPNPFEKTTNIIINLETSTMVEITMYNFIGQKIETLFKGYSAPGKLAVAFNAETLTQGIYFYTVKTNDFALTKKVTLLK